MKFEKNPKYFTIAVYAFTVIAISILFLEMLRNFSFITEKIKELLGYIQPVIYGVVFAFVLNPMMRMYDDRLLPRISKRKLSPKARRGIAIGLTYLSALVLVSVFLSLVLPQVIISINSLIYLITSYLNDLTNEYGNFDMVTFITDLPFLQAFGPEVQANLQRMLLEALESALTAVLDFLEETIINLGSGLMDIMGSVLNLVGGAFNSAFSLVMNVVNLLLGIIISIYFLADREKLFAQMKKITTALFRPRTCTILFELAYDSNRIFNGFIVGKIIDSIIIGIICFIGMCFICPSYAVLIALIIGVTNIIPYFGPFIGAIPSFFLVLISDGIAKSVVFLVFILVLQQFDGNILGPKILGDTTGLSALWVVFSIMLFSGMLGVLGMFIGVPLFAIIYTMLKRLIGHLLRKKGESDNTRDYASLKNPLIK